MKKRWLCIALIVGVMLSLTGCGNAIPEMTAEQQTMVTEYAAAMLLKYDANYEPKLLDDERLAEEEAVQKRIEEENARLEALQAAQNAPKEESAKDEDSAESNASSQEAVANVDPAVFMEMDGISISCNGVEFVDAYPESGGEVFLSVTPSAGCKLAVVRLDMVNNGSADAAVDMFAKDAKFKVSFNGGEYHNTMMSLLEDDFTMYAGTIAPGQKVSTVLLVDLKEEECNPVTGLNLYIKYNDQTTKTAIYP
ncbi:MAG: hypothetical protein IJZ44_08825 [Lachnospiraceae bacterium]|nr:hypothetical protein [Lachnospiraceae bacterium]